MSDCKHPIVGEVSKNWIAGEEPEPPLLSEQFEKLIHVNDGRGYFLADWRMGRVVTEAEGKTVINETIIAVFDPKPEPAGE